MNEKMLVLTFKKDSGTSYSMNIPYPIEPVSAENINRLAETMIQNQIFVFPDGSKLSTFEKAVLQEVTKTPVEL